MAIEFIWQPKRDVYTDMIAQAKAQWWTAFYNWLYEKDKEAAQQWFFLSELLWCSNA